MIARTSSSAGAAARVFPREARIELPGRSMGGPSAARPIITPSAPLSSSAFNALADYRCRRSRIPAGATAALDRALSFRTRPRPGKSRRACGRARRWPATPSRSAMRAMRDGIAVLAVPAGAHLERDRHRARATTASRMRTTSDSSRISAEPAGPIAYLLGRTAEVDVDDLRRRDPCSCSRPRPSAPDRSRRSARRGARVAAMVEPMTRLRRFQSLRPTSPSRMRRRRRPCCGTDGETAGR